MLILNLHYSNSKQSQFKFSAISIKLIWICLSVAEIKTEHKDIMKQCTIIILEQQCIPDYKAVNVAPYETAGLWMKCASAVLWLHLGEEVSRLRLMETVHSFSSPIIRRRVHFLGLCRDGAAGYSPRRSHWCISDPFTTLIYHCSVMKAAQSYFPSDGQAQYRSKLGTGKIRDVLKQWSAGFFICSPLEWMILKQT